MISLISHWEIDAIVSHVKVHGSQGVETGGFLLRDQLHDVRIIALAESKGIDRHSHFLTFSGEALEALCDWSDNADLKIVAQFHSHEGGAFLSATDERGGMRIEGFVSFVIPKFSKPNSDISAWGWWRFTSNVWTQETPPTIEKSGTARVVHFDESGVREQ